MSAQILCFHWFQAWGRHIESARSQKRIGLSCDGFCRAAMIAQAYAVMWHALEAWK